jgi:hypothetical protein
LTLQPHYTSLTGLRIFSSSKYKFIYQRTFNYSTLLRIWDIYLLKGEIFLYELGLALIKVQEKDLTSIPLKDVLKNLKKSRVREDDVFNLLNNNDITEEYKKMLFEDNLANEKGLLFQSLLLD